MLLSYVVGKEQVLLKHLCMTALTTRQWNIQTLHPHCILLPHDDDLAIPDPPQSSSMSADDDQDDEQDAANQGLSVSVEPDFSPLYGPPGKHLIISAIGINKKIHF